MYPGGVWAASSDSLSGLRAGRTAGTNAINPVSPPIAEVLREIVCRGCLSTSDLVTFHHLMETISKRPATNALLLIGNHFEAVSRALLLGCTGLGEHGGGGTAPRAVVLRVRLAHLQRRLVHARHGALRPGLCAACGGRRQRERVRGEHRRLHTTVVTSVLAGLSHNFMT